MNLPRASSRSASNKSSIELFEATTVSSDSPLTLLPITLSIKRIFRFKTSMTLSSIESGETMWIAYLDFKCVHEGVQGVNSPLTTKTTDD